MVITFEEVLKQIEELSTRQPQGFTVREMSIYCGRPKSWCRKKIGQLIDAGKVRWNGRKTTTRIDGAPTTAPVYLFISNEDNDLRQL